MDAGDQRLVIEMAKLLTLDEIGPGNLERFLRDRGVTDEALISDLSIRALELVAAAEEIGKQENPDSPLSSIITTGIPESPIPTGPLGNDKSNGYVKIEIPIGDDKTMFRSISVEADWGETEASIRAKIEDAAKRLGDRYDAEGVSILWETLRLI